MEDLIAAAKEAMNLAQTHRTARVLADCSALSGGHTIFDLFDLAKDFAAAAQSINMQEAVIIPAGSAKVVDVKFWETTCVNRGLNVRIFHDRQSAIDWLTK